MVVVSTGDTSLKSDFVDPLLEQRIREALAVTGGDCLFLVPQEGPPHIFGTPGGAESILRTMPQRVDDLVRIVNPMSSRNLFSDFDAASAGSLSSLLNSGPMIRFGR